MAIITLEDLAYAHYQTAVKAVRGASPVDSEVPWAHYSDQMRAPHVEAAKQILGALERARVVAVLDGWAAKDLERFWVSGPTYTGNAYCSLRSSDAHKDSVERVAYHAATPDEARAKAAEAIEKGEV